MWTVHCVNNMVVFCYFSFSNHHEKWPWSKTTIINSNPFYLNCTLWVAKKCWVAKLFCEMRIFLGTVQHLINLDESFINTIICNMSFWFIFKSTNGANAWCIIAMKNLLPSANFFLLLLWLLQNELN